MEGIKGYKVFRPDWTCCPGNTPFQYEVGKTYNHQGPIAPCSKGFHFCVNAADCFNYYDFNPNNKVAEVLATGLVETEGNKSVTNEIVIVREVPWQELLTIVNTGKGCTGLRNSGNRNSGNRNSGYYNSGDYNSGNRNSGNRNSGNRNSGNRNSGNRNSGDYNSGYCNSGDYNSGDYNSGYCNTTEPCVRMFNQDTKLTFEEASKLDGLRVLRWNYEDNWWIYSESMTEEEKKAHPEHETTGGYLKVVSMKEAYKLMWENLSEEEKQMVYDLPNFDRDVWKDLTGIEVE